MIDTPSILSLTLTLALSLLSALAFVLLYIRSPSAQHSNNHHPHSHSWNSATNPLHSSHSHPTNAHNTLHSHGPHSHGPHSHATSLSNHSDVEVGHGKRKATTASGSEFAAGGGGGGLQQHCMCSNCVAHSTSHPACSMHGAGNSTGVGSGSGVLNGSHGMNGNDVPSSSSHLASHASSISSSPTHTAHSSNHSHPHHLHQHAHSPSHRPTASSLTAGDIALRGRKSKKRGAASGGVGGHHGSGSGSVGGSGKHRQSISSTSNATTFIHSLNFIPSAPPVVLCLTSLPSRVHHIDKCLQSIKQQSYPLNLVDIVMAIPEESRREQTKFSLPDRVRKDAAIRVVRVSTDYGPSTRLISAWSAIPSGPSYRNALIICLDDDCIYHPDTIATLVRHSMAHPDAALAFAGYKLQGRPYVHPNLKYARRREERAEMIWRETQKAVATQLAVAADNAAQNGLPSATALAAAAASASHALQHHAAALAASSSSASSSSASPSSALHPLSPLLDPSLLPPADPLSTAAVDTDPYSLPLPNPNDLYPTESVDVLQVWRGGLCVRKRHLDERLWTEYKGMPEAAYWADDEWISAQLAKNGVQRRVILAPFEPLLSRLRLPHGRHSASATHLAHQQTLLELLVEKHQAFGASASSRNRKSASTSAQYGEATVNRTENGAQMNGRGKAINGNAAIEGRAHPSINPIPLDRLNQLIRPITPEPESDS